MLRRIYTVMIASLLCHQVAHAEDYEARIAESKKVVATYFKSAQAGDQLTALVADLGSDADAVKASIDSVKSHIAMGAELSKSALAKIDSFDEQKVLSLQAISRLTLAKLALTRLQLAIIQRGLNTAERLAIITDLAKALDTSVM